MRKYFMLIIAITVALTSLNIEATNVSSKKNELSETKKELENSKKQLQNNENEKKIEEAAVQELDKNIIDVENKLLELEEKLENKTNEVEEVQIVLEEAREKKNYQYDIMKKRMVQMYKNGRTGYMKLAFSANNMSELLTRTQYIKTISEYDHQVLDTYKEQEIIVAETEEKLALEQANLKTLVDKQVETKENLETKRIEKNTRLGILEKEGDVLQSEIEEIEAEYKAIQKEIDRLTANSTVKYSGGKFAWPVPGNYRVSSEYYNRINPVTGRAEFHKGIDIPAGYGKAVVAAADGVVITAGNLGTFGKTVIIDNGSGITTTYAHNSSVIVSVGQKVTKGQQIAKIGSTGRSTGNHSHFEVRVNGKHTSPWNYLSK
ncbi:MAG: murein hydrolase activator EnvC family protein [Cellulosilyticaceae bacterium]